MKHRKAILAVSRLVLLFAFSTTIHGEAVTPSDYYGNEYGKRLIKDVEEHHIGPGIQRMNGKPHMWIYALQDFDFVLAYYPNHPQGLKLKAEVAMKMGKPQLAEESFQKAIRLYPHTTGTYILYAIFLQQNGKLEAAEANYKKALDSEPASVNAHYNLGLLYFDKKQYELANAHAQQAYAMGHPLPGLRKKLESINAWKPEPGSQGTTAASTEPPAQAIAAEKNTPAEQETTRPESFRHDPGARSAREAP